MKKTIFTGLSSLLLPLGLYGVPTQAAIGYQRSSYLSAGISATSTHVSMETLAQARELTMREAVVSDELDIVSAEPVNELVVIDAAVPDKHVLYRGIKPGVEIVELDASTAGLAQLTAIFTRYKNLSAVHIVSHAEEGVLLLGSSRITAENIQQEMEILSALTGAVRDGGDLLFYGCNLAADSSGEALLDIIRDNTGLDVAASNDRTGNASLAGDWDLEIESGQIETDLAFSRKALMDFSGILAAEVYTAVEIYDAAYPDAWGQASLPSADNKIIFSSPPSGVVNAGGYGSTLGYLAAYGDPLQIAADGTNAVTFELHELVLSVYSSNQPTGELEVALTVTGFDSSDTNIGSTNISVTTASIKNTTNPSNLGQPEEADVFDLSAIFGSTYDLKRVVISYDGAPASDYMFALRSVTLDDIQAPIAVPTATLDASSDTGASSTDNITNDTTPTFTGTTTTGATVTLFNDANNNGTIDAGEELGTGTATGGNWSITTSALAAGTYNVRAIAENGGATSAASTGLSVTIDTTAPAAPSAPDLTAASDRGTSDTDDLTSDTTPTFTGTAEAGTTVRLYANGTEVGSVTADGSGNWSITSDTLGEGTYFITARAQDAAGNLSSVSSTLSVTIDATGPVVSAPDMTPASDSGSSNTDNITNVRRPEFTGSAPAGTLVQLFIDNAGNGDATDPLNEIIGTGTADVGGTWSITSNVDLYPGTWSIKARGRDDAGNFGAASSSVDVTVDITPPAAIPSVPDLATGSDSGSSNSDNITNDTTPTFSGTHTANNVVRLYANGMLVGSATADGSGNWTITSDALGAGTYSFTARGVDLAGNEGTASTGLSVTIDPDTPAAPSTPDMEAGSDTGNSDSDNNTEDTTPTFSGTGAEANATVYLYVGGVEVGESTADGSGNWSVTVSAGMALDAGDYFVVVRTEDAAGNLSNASGALSIHINTAPTANGNLSQTVNYTEDPGGSVALGDIVVTDVDPGEAITATLTLSDTAAGALSTGTYGSATSTFDDGTGVWTVTGSVADVNAALAAVAFTPAADWDQNVTITTRIRDANGSGPTDGTITLNVTAVSDAPTATNLTQSKTVTEGGGAVALDDIVVTDGDTGDTVTATLTLSDASAGSLSTGTFGSATSTYNAGTGVWTVTGSVADINAALAAVALTPSANNDQNFTITTRIRDAANTGPADGTVSITVTGVNDAPAATNLTQSKAATEAGGAVALDDIVVGDVDTGDTITATLTLSNASAGSLSTGTFGSATSTYNAGTGVWTITGSVADINAALAAVALTPSANNDQNFTIATRIRDAADTGPADGTISITVTGVNDAPTATNLTQSKAATEGGGAVALDDIVVTDPDTGDTLTATLTLSDASAGSLSTGTYGSATSTYNAGTGVWTITGSVADINAALAAVALTPSVDNDQNFTIATRIRDAADTGPADGTITLNVTAVNDAPTDIALNSLSINESSTGAGAAVGTLSSTDPDSGATHTYALIDNGGSGNGSCGATGDDDNALFQIDNVNDELETAASLSAGSYNICVETDDGTDSYQETFTITVSDDVAPTVSSVSVPANASYAAGQNLDFTVNTSENVTVNTGGGTPRITLTIGTTTRQAIFIGDSGTSALVFRYTTQAGDNDTDGIAVAASIDLNGGTLQDGAGNDLNATLNSVGTTTGVRVDTAAPTADIVVADTALIAGETSLVTITFNEAITGFANDDLTLGNGTLSSVSSADGGVTWTATFTPSVDTTSATNVITLNNTGVTDIAGNAGVGTTDSNNYAVDTLRPSATIVLADNELNMGETTLVTVTFNRAVSAFDNADLTADNGSLSPVSSADSGITWTTTFTPDADIDEPDNFITLDNTGVIDEAGNAGTGISSSSSYVIRTMPTPLLVTSNLDTGDDETNAATLEDDQLDGGGLSIREALYWVRGGDTITFDLDSSTAGNQGGSITLNGNALVITYGNIMIDGDLNDDGIADVTLSANNASRVMTINNSLSDIELTGLTLTDGTGIDGGGGLFIDANSVVIVRDSTITNNTESGLGGGGIFSVSATLTMINSTVSNNTSNAYGGGIRAVSTGSTLNLINSTVSGNSTTGAAQHGGGIHFGSTAGLTIINSTISGNSAVDTGAVGGGLRISSGTSYIVNTTIVGNAATGGAGGMSANGTDTMVNTVVAGNSAGAGATAGVAGSPLATGGAPDDVGGIIEVATNSFFGTSAAVTTDTNSLNNQGTTNLLLADLAANGGNGLTHRPQIGSVLADAGSTAALPVDTYDLDGDTNVTEALPVDALGASRVSGTAVDIGAVEGNRAPELFDLNGGNTYLEGGVAVVIDNDVTVTDDELDGLNGGNGNYNGTSVTILRNGGVDASDTFGFLDGSGMSLVAGEVIKNGQSIATFDTATAGQLVVTYTDANGEVPERSDVNAMMQQITYATTSNDPDTSVVLDWTFTDEAGAPVTETASVTVSLKNDAPVVAATGGTPTFTEGGIAVDLFSAVNINPVEAAQSIISLQLTVTGVNNGSDEILAIDGSDVALTQANALVTATNALDVSVAVAGTTATVTLSHATGITGAAAQAVIDGLTYRNTNENPNPLTRVVTLSSVQDNGGVANSGADTAAPAIAATVAISAVNNAPTITGTPATVTDQNALYSFTPSAADVDSDTLTFSIANQPSWASFDDETGTLSGVPSQANVGVTSNIVITVSDGSESTSLPAFSLTVVDVNDAPVIGGTPAASLDQDTPYLFIPTASDLDGDDLTFSLANQPAWASFDPATGTLAGTPDVDDVGVYPNIIITVSDGALTADLPGFSIEVLATNVAPEISGTPPLTAYVGAAYSFTPTASDADDDELTFSALGLPSWLILNTTTGQLSGTPGAADADMSYNIALSVSDGIETVTLPVFSLTVEYDGAEPVVTPPEDITINAIGLYTPISLRQLLSLPPGTSAAAVQDALRDLASDSTGGEDCCVTQPQGLLANLILLPPGRHEIVWRATNPDGLTGEAVQVVNVRPRVAFGKHQVAVENTSVQVRVILNGRSPFYPLEVPYVIDPASTALLGIDHDAMDGSVTFTEGQTEVSFTVNLLAGGTAGDTRLIIRLDDSSPRSNEPIPNYDPANPDIRDINAGAADQHFINIVEGNVIPKVSLVMNQSGADTILVGAGSGPVTATAVVTDPNPGDTHSFNWAGTDSRLSDTDGSATNNTFVFDPAGQVGLRKLEVITTDSAGGVDTSHLHFLILPSLPTLDAGTDTDEDGVDDLTEGTSDTNSNGIPDYLDNMPSSNVLPQVIISTTSYLIECDPGVLCGIGQFALGGDSGGVQILNDELGVTEGLVADEDFEPTGGIFDFVIRDLPTAGQSVRIVIPQQAPIPANAVYRKFMGGDWVNFVENADNTLHSAPGNPGYCPPPGDDTWAPGLVEGYLCVQLNIQDGGPNDADGVVNSAIADPGAVSSAKPVAPPPPPPPPPATSIDSKGKGGGALDWTWLLFGGVLLVLRRYGSKKPAVLLLVVALFSGASQAQPEAGDTYLRLNVYQAEGDQSAGDFSRAMAGDGMAVSLRDYDESRMAYRLSVGYQWSEATSVELGYLDLGDVTVNFDTTVTDMAALTRALEEHYPMSADGFTLSHRFGHHFTSGLSLSGEVGIFMWDGKIDVDGAAIDPDLGSGIDPLLGVQLDYRLAEPVSVGLGYQRIFFDSQAVDLIGVSGIWHF